MWLVRCYKAGIVTEEQTGIPFSRVGSLEFIETLLRKIAYREGFGDTLARGTHKAAQSLGKEAQALIKDYIAPWLGTFSTGYSVLAGGIVLAVMIFPIIIHVCLEVFRCVEQDCRLAHAWTTNYEEHPLHTRSQWL
jgi:hypothetical protein